MDVGPAEAEIPREQSVNGSPAGGALDQLGASFEEYYALVYRYLVHRLFDRELADELTAETFYQAARSIGKMNGDMAGLRNWLLRIAVNVANTHYRRASLRRVLLPWIAAEKGGLTDDAVQMMDAADNVEQVRTAIKDLAPKYQSVVVLRYYLEMSFSEIAGIEGCREDAVRARLSRAIKQIRRRLEAGEV